MPPYGQMFQAGEVILVYLKNEPSFFARVEKIQQDRKKGWWQMSFLILSIPLKPMTWILDEDQVRGGEFTMGGTAMKIERVESPEGQSSEMMQIKKRDDDSQEGDAGARIVSLFDDDDE